MQGLAPTEAAKMLNVHPQTIRRWLKEKKLRGWMIGGRYRVDPVSVKQMVTRIGLDTEIEKAIGTVEATFGSIKADPDLVKEIALMDDLFYVEDAE